MKNANFRRPIRRKLSLILAVAALIAAFAAAWRLSPLMSSESLLATWNWLMFDRQGYSGSAFRNMLWAVGLILGLILATWRVKVSNWQAQTAEWSHRESRYEKGADMLGSDKMPIRVFGVAALRGSRRIIRMSTITLAWMRSAHSSFWLILPARAGNLDRRH